MVVNTNRPSKKTPDNNEGRRIPMPVVIIGSVLAIVFFLFMYNTYVGPILPHGARKAEHVAPPPGYPDVPPYNTKEWQQNAKPGQRMPGVPPIDYSKQSGPGPSQGNTQ